jgi:hypothetical protein
MSVFHIECKGEDVEVAKDDEWMAFTEIGNIGRRPCLVGVP